MKNQDENLSEFISGVEERYVKISYKEFINPKLLFDGIPSIIDHNFVQEVIVQRRMNENGSYSWINPIPLHNSQFVKTFIKNHLIQDSPSPLYRGPIVFSILFKYTIDVRKPLDEIILKLEDLTERVRVLRDWVHQKNAIILKIGNNPGILDILVTKNVFEDACERFSWNINENEIVTLAEDSHS